MSSVSPYCLLCSIALSISTSAAQLTVAPEDLPRIPPTEPNAALKTFQVRDGFRLELVAAEPLVVDPIAMSFDEEGKLYVVEMRDYSERRDERLGRIRVLTDQDGDGQFDQSHTFASDLPWPTAVICYDGGVFVGSTPDILFLKDTDGDGAADYRKVIFTGFGSGQARLNVQQLLNSFTWGLDNRIHGANGGNGGRIFRPELPDKVLELRNRDFSFDPRTLEIRPESGGAQYGLSFDNDGRKFVCSNSAHIQQVLYEEKYASRNASFSMPSPLVNIAVDGPAAEVFRISPDEPWRVIRTRWRVTGKVPGLIEGGGRPSGYFTGATGVTIYRGNAWPENYLGDAFIADIGSNLIHRKKLHQTGIAFSAKRPDDELKREFIASKDNWFRPTQFANAPDGTLYVSDMYREVIEHPWSIPEPIKKNLDLNSGNDRGRIYRIVPEHFKQPALPRLKSASTAELVQLLDHANGWHRDTAARLLYQKQDKDAVSLLKEALRTGSPLKKQHSLYALHGLKALTPEILKSALEDTLPHVRRHAVRLLSNTSNDMQLGSWEETLERLAQDTDPLVRYQLAFAAGEFESPLRISLLASLAKKDSDQFWMRTAILNSSGGDAGQLLLNLINNATVSDSPAGQELLVSLAQIAGVSHDANQIKTILTALHPKTTPALTFKITAALIDKHSPQFQKLLQNHNINEVLQPVHEQAIHFLQDSASPKDLKVSALLALSTADWESTRPILLTFLSPRHSSELQTASVKSLLRRRDPESSEELVKKFPQLRPESRHEVLATFISRPDQTIRLLEGVENGLIQKSEFTSAQVQQLKTHSKAEVRSRATRLFKENDASIKSRLEAYQSSLDLQGNSARGKQIFMDRCASCHRLNGEGYGVGPDLASVRSNGKEKLLISILDPNREVPPQFTAYTIETLNGDSFTGLIAAETDSSLILRQSFRNEVPVLRHQIRSVRSTQQSLMPEGLEASLSAQNMADLLEFIAAGD